MNTLKILFQKLLMTNSKDIRIRNLLNDLHDAHLQSEQFISAKPLDPFEIKKPRDIYDMALAYDTESCILMELELAYSERYPEAYTADQIDFIKKEIERFGRRIRSWNDRQFPKG